jgi:hypothetical protein
MEKTIEEVKGRELSDLPCYVLAVAVAGRTLFRQLTGKFLTLKTQHHFLVVGTGCDPTDTNTHPHAPLDIPNSV